MKYFDGTTSAVINAIAPQLSVRIPEATAANLQEIGDLILSQRQLTNEFLNALVNRIWSGMEISPKKFLSRWPTLMNMTREWRKMKYTSGKFRM